MCDRCPPLAAIHTVALDFDGVFTDNKVQVDENGLETVQCDRRDGLAFDLVRAFQRRGKLDAEFFILSKEPNPVVMARARKLRLECHFDVTDKLSFMREHLAKRFPGKSDLFAGLVYLGNDLNDLALLGHAGLAVAPSDAHPRVHAVANLVLAERGGHGFVRAFVEHLLDINQLTDGELDELISDR